MLKNRTSALAVAAVIAACCFGVIAQSTSANRSTISGFVFSQNKRPVPDVYVELLNDVNTVLRRVKTDGSGRFLFNGISSGRFTIKVIPAGTDYDEQTEDVEIAGVGARGRLLSDNIQKDIYLRSRKNVPEALGKGGSVFFQEIPEAAKKEYEKAVVDIDSKRIDIGTEELKNALKIFPDYYSALEKLCVIYMRQEKYDDAVEVTSRMVKVNPRSFNGFYGLGYANNSLRRFKPAVEALRQAISLNSNSAEATLLLGLVLRSEKSYDEAEKTLKRADKLSNGKSADVHWNLALLYSHNLKRYTEAADELESYLRVRPDAPNKTEIQKLIKKFRESPNS